MERNTKRGIATARNVWRVVWGNVRYEVNDGNPERRPTPYRDRGVAMAALYARNRWASEGRRKNLIPRRALPLP